MLSMIWCSNCASKENEKNLASQRLNFLQEKESSLQDFLHKSEGQLKGLEESILFTEEQVNEEKNKLESSPTTIGRSQK